MVFAKGPEDAVVCVKAVARDGSVDTHVHRGKSLPIPGHEAFVQGQIDFFLVPFQIPKRVQDLWIAQVGPTVLVASKQTTPIAANVYLVPADAADTQQMNVRRTVEYRPLLTAKIGAPPPRAAREDVVVRGAVNVQEFKGTGVGAGNKNSRVKLSPGAARFLMPLTAVTANIQVIADRLDAIERSIPPRVRD